MEALAVQRQSGLSRDSLQDAGCHYRERRGGP